MDPPGFFGKSAEVPVPCPSCALEVLEQLGDAYVRNSRRGQPQPGYKYLES